ncbi:MAG TPA: efflux RND transporter periplasmic adaptor subunit [Saprospiraceae bacterium]|nr:efflux RND transporter periplasmic adaptor subunit [Saprospiraceae bacterium]HMQ83499.1 efflux RND transporter periplasmic adaptor subunit [Saprospiraceae bacterium]
MIPKYNKCYTALALALVVSACGSDNKTDKATPEAPKSRVEVAQVVPVQHQEAIFATGQLALEDEAKLSFKIGGIIRNVYVKEGQYVQQGQLIAELKPDEIQAQTQQARLGRQQADIQYENAKLALRLAERDYKNVKGLYEDSVATLEQMENVEVQLENARNQLQAAQRALDLSDENIQIADFNYQFSKIVAPANGTILKKFAEGNELVGPGNPIVLFGSKDKAPVIQVNLADKDIVHVQIGDEAAIRFDAYADQVFKGTVQEIAGMADPYTNTFEVKIALKTDGKSLLPGFIGRVEIFTSSASTVYEVPIDALSSADGKEGILYLYENGKAIETKVFISKMEGKSLLVSRGLDSADLVITTGVGYLENEQNVWLTEK